MNHQIKSNFKSVEKDRGMFLYLYDAFVLQSKYQATLTKVEHRIIELGINGRVEKLSALRNMKELLESGIHQGAHTIIVVGNDSALLQAINIVAPHDVAIGYIPFSEESRLAKLLGITSTLEACNILSRRILTTIDLAKANENYFLTTAHVSQTASLKLQCDNSFTISFRYPGATMTINNLGDLFSDTIHDLALTNNKSHLSLIIEEPPTTQGFLRRNTTIKPSSHFSAQRIQIEHENEPIAMTLDNEMTLQTPITITLKPRQQKIIVGKQRLV